MKSFVVRCAVLVTLSTMFITTQGCPVANQPRVSVRVLNVSSAAMLGLYVVPATAQDWGPNLLTSPLYQDQSFDVYGLQSGQYYHFAAAMQNGQVLYQYNQYIPANEILTWTIYNDKSEIAWVSGNAAAVALPLLMLASNWLFEAAPLCAVCA